MRDVHRSVHPAFGYIWFLPNFYDYLITKCWGQKSSCKQACIGFLTSWPWYHNKQNWYLFCSWAPWKPTCNSGKFLCKLSFSEKQNGRMIIGFFIEMIKLNENKKSDFKRVRNWTYPLFWNETEKQISGRTVCKIKMHF